MNRSGQPPPLPDFDAMWDYSRPADTEQRFRRLLSEFHDAPPAYLAELRTQIARTLSLQDRFEEAHALLDEIEAVLDAEGMPAAEVRLRLERGRTFNSSGQRAAAIAEFERAWRAATALGRDELAVDAAHMLAIALPEAALKWNETALGLAETSPDPRARRWLGSLHNNLGWTRHARSDFEKALTHFERALESRRESGALGAVHVARWCVARCLRSLGRVEEALAIQLELATDAQNDSEPGFTHEELGECLLDLGRHAEARPHFIEAHARLSRLEWLKRDEPERIARLARIARDGED